jgi:hypothetical protein
LPPVITAVGLNEHGELVIVGERFGGDAALPVVRLGGVALTVTNATDDEIHAAVPPGTGPGSYVVLVRNVFPKLLTRTITRTP